jgi:hypothetical protein
MKMSLALASSTVLGSVVLSVAAAAPPAAPAARSLSAHQEPRGIGNLIAPGDRVEIGYTLDTPGVRSATGSLYVRNDLRRGFSRLPLKLNRGLGQLWGLVPGRMVRGQKLFYYAVIRDQGTGRSVTVPAAGARSPKVAWVLEKPLVVRLGTHSFGNLDAPEAVVARARPDEVGWRDPPPGEGLRAGPQTFLVARDGSVWLDDELNDRVLVWEPGRPDAVARSVPLPPRSEDSDIAFGPAGTLYVTRLVGTGRATRIVLDRVTASGKVLWETHLGGEYSPLAKTFVLGANSHLSVGPEGTLYCLAFMALPGDEWGWMPVATPDGRALSPAAQRRGTHWPFQPVAGGLRLLSETYAPPGAETAPHEARYALIDRHGRLVRGWRILSRTDLSATSLTPELVGGDLVAAVGVTAGSDPVANQEYVVLRLGPDRVHARLILRRALWGGALTRDLRLGADGKLYQLSSSPSMGVAIQRYSLG